MSEPAASRYVYDRGSCARILVTPYQWLDPCSEGGNLSCALDRASHVTFSSPVSRSDLDVDGSINCHCSCRNRYLLDCMTTWLSIPQPKLVAAAATLDPNSGRSS